VTASGRGRIDDGALVSSRFAVVTIRDLHDGLAFVSPMRAHRSVWGKRRACSVAMVGAD